VSRKNTHEKPIDAAHTSVFGKMFVAPESKATKRPSAVIAESRLCPFTAEPSWVTVMRIVEGMHPEGAPMQVSRS
jgi:hypothetical protein